MTTQYAVFSGLPTGLTLTKKVFTVADPDVEVTGITGAVTERTNAKGQYTVAVTKSAVITGIHTIILFVGSTPIAIGKRTFAGTDGETATETPPTVVLDPASRVKLDASQPDYAPATAAALAAMRGADNDTLKTLSDQIDGIDGGALTGPFTRTITVIDAADDSPIEAAKVRLYRTGETDGMI